MNVLCRLSDKAMNTIPDLLKDAFEQAKFLTSGYEDKKIINKLGLNYMKIDVCPKDCKLYLGDEKHLEAYNTCGTSRWKPKKKKKIATKILHYFPLEPRLQRLFPCFKITLDIRCHALENNKDWWLRYPTDGEACKTFDLIHPEFALDPQTILLGLATNGFSPTSTLSATYSIWPVFFSPYNLPPWMFMKYTSFILSMIIPGKKSLGNNIDVYLRPVVEELCELWNDGIEIFDSSLNQNFRLHATLIWTNSDFPGLGMFFGWNTHVGLACLTCSFDAKPCRLYNGKMWCFMSHQHFLSKNYRFRLAHVHFDVNTEKQNPLLKVSGSNIFG